MTKKFSIIALTYAGIGLGLGVFYREFTKFNNFTDRTTLGFMHVHYLALGCLFFLILLLLDYKLKFKESKLFKISEIIYHVGLNIAVVSLLVRGIIQVLGNNVSSGVSGAISGIAGIGHVLLGGGLILILVSILLIVNKQNKEKKETEVKEETK